MAFWDDCAYADMIGGCLDMMQMRRFGDRSGAIPQEGIIPQVRFMGVQCTYWQTRSDILSVVRP